MYPSISIGKDKIYYHLATLEECKYVAKEQNDVYFITDDIEISSGDCDKEDYDEENSDEEN